ncbi:MAG TPA: sulfur carrier protein ThiS [Victivallales bacterium]|nr:sulfur carrier protein ThiS [Victivallales bacterium]HPO90506.1 sulfur carrier protein ThiS [Victivallales bacterium]HRR06358.1 sulfur carrier protein ThiS [Victivallales bacterium]HRU01168.1 sulfur carrier protein ThiS [Victivallales bacterium]
MRIFINAVPEEVEDMTKLSELLKKKSYDGKKSIVVILNDNLVEKEKYEEILLKQDDKIELFSFVQGG